MRILILAAAIAASAIPTVAFAQTTPAPAAAAGGYTVEDTDVGTLIDDPAAKAVLDKHLPGFSTNDQVAMARSMSLKTLQQYAPETFTDKALTDIQTDLNKLPKK